LTAHSRYTLSAALKFAAACGATLTLAHVTPSFELYGPGGLHVEQPLKETLFGHATRVLTALQREAGCQVEVILEGGNVPRALNRAAKNAGSDLLILGRMPPGGHLGQNGGGLAIVRGSHIPVLCL
jgi:nucleotide-binding universal stress UspA family protein